MKRILFSLILLLLLPSCALPVGQATPIAPPRVTVVVVVPSQPTATLPAGTQPAAVATAAAVATTVSPEQSGQPLTRHFEDAYAGLAFDYPAGWFINSPPDASKEGAPQYIISLSQQALDTLPELGGQLPREDVPLIVIVANGAVSGAGAALTYPQAIEQRKAEYAASNPPVTVAAEEEIDLPGGGKATCLYLSLPEGQQVEMVTAIHGRRVIVSALDRTESLLVFESIAASLLEE